ncbi:pyrimidine-nucleoside phosphorylase [Thermanaeromonas toyohensis ToBE]|uniref:Pyrimidine-nucleoside phosphorylase n=1 Tax=Thermanaeromonas toyohensis ToBE TaxID=698762 RepID=A0A1W1W0W2_9FIRM|nr:pyrimidine-nucleoside phosphorylase [Thermanaeromonas toyohensis]SMB98744.1 pyrimidine-nucleoside phosphorylase [Thermanaeromonas toyohensis ToBE]
MRMYDLIKKKRDGGVFSRQEIEFIVKGFTSGEIPDYQMAALAMAIYFQGMNIEETVNLTLAMVDSGVRLDLSSIPGIKVDKHSTGGVADTTTLVLAPLVASCGVPVAKLSGRGLGHTGGTIDKLESIPGLKVELSLEEFKENVKRYGIAIASQTEELTPADKKLYALRDVTATVDSIPLIASSIMSKKIAAGADAIVLDVKVGQGAFMKDLPSARKLAQVMVEIGRSVGRRTIAYITNMDQPLGLAIGNSLEVAEAIQVLRGEGSQDLINLCLELGSAMLVLGGKAKDKEEGKKKLKEALVSRKALEKFREFILAQGGEGRVVEDLNLLPQARFKESWLAKEEVYLAELPAERLGQVAMKLGAGREKKGEKIDLAVGLVLGGKVGDRIDKGKPIVTVYANDENRLKVALEELKACIKLSSTPLPPLPLILEEVS